MPGFVRTLTAGAIVGIAACAGPPPPPRTPLVRPAVHPAPSATTAPAATPAPVPVLLGLTGPVGTPHPAIFERASSRGAWAVLCQARADTDGSGDVAVRVGPGPALSGDALIRYLVVGKGDGTAIDALAAEDPTGRFVVTLRSGRLWLVDAGLGVELELNADARDDTSGELAHRAVGFDPSGRRLAFLRPDGRRAVVRELSTGAERELDVGPGEVWRLRFDASGSVLVADVVHRDDNENGRLDWPYPARSAPPPCRGPLPTLSATTARGDAIVSRLIALDGRPTRDVPELVAPIGPALLLRRPSGELSLQTGAIAVPVASEACGGRVLYADWARPALLVACSKDGHRAPLQLFTAQGTTALGVDVAVLRHDHPPVRGERWLAIYPGADSAVLDLDTGRLLPLSRGDTVISTWGQHALVRAGRRLLWLDLTSGARKDLGVETDRIPERVLGPRHAVVTPWVVDRAKGAVLGRSPGRALAVFEDGRVLCAARDGDAEQLPLGPLQAVRPEPPATAQPKDAM